MKKSTVIAQAEQQLSHPLRDAANVFVLPLLQRTKKILMLMIRNNGTTLVRARNKIAILVNSTAVYFPSVINLVY
jgi:hypothetical protein